ncbi:hypothetical protein D3C72_2159790 [compost metagenome]
MAPAGNGEGERIVDLRPGITARRGEVGQGAGDIEFGQGVGEVAQRLGAAEHIVTQARKDLELDLQRRLMRPGDAALEIGQF